MTGADCTRINIIVRDDNWADSGSMDLISKRIIDAVLLENLCWCENHTAFQYLRCKPMFPYGSDNEAIGAKANA